jgi:hypothetical protein
LVAVSEPLGAARPFPFPTSQTRSAPIIKEPSVTIKSQECEPVAGNDVDEGPRWWFDRQVVSLGGIIEDEDRSNPAESETPILPINAFRECADQKLSSQTSRPDDANYSNFLPSRARADFDFAMSSPNYSIGISSGSNTMLPITPAEEIELNVFR